MALSSLFYWLKRAMLPGSSGEVGRSIPATVGKHGEVHGKEHRCRETKDLRPVTYSAEHPPSAGHCAQSQGFAVNRTVVVTVLTGLQKPVNK